MPLPVPTLDSRSWDELTNEAVALIPRYAPEWTDFNYSDPGITLAELYAWLSELLLFRADQVTPAVLRTFLRLVGVRPEPAGVAATAVAFRSPSGAAPLTLPAGTRLSDAQNDVQFATADTVEVTEAWIELSPSEGTSRGRILVDAGGTVQDVTLQNVVGPTFAPFGDAPAPGDSLELGFDVVPAAPGTALSLFVWTPSWTSDAATAAAIRGEAAALAADCPPPGATVWPNCEECLAAVKTTAGPAHRSPPAFVHYWARTAWEYSTGANTWSAFPTARDETCALSLSGAVELVGQPDHAAGGDGRYWIRCRLTAGGYDCPPSLTAIAVNAIPALDAVSAPTSEDLGASLGQAGQSFALSTTPVVAGSTRLRVTAPGGAVDDGWREVSTWDQTGPDDQHYTCEPSLGTVTFGDGRVGRVPRAGSDLTMETYDIGGGLPGDVAAGRLTAIPGGPAGVTPLQPFAAVGAGSAETLTHAHGRAIELVESVTRAVTLDDLVALALATPGAPLGRAQALAERHPAFSCLPAPGAVTVVVLPRCGSPPEPSCALLCLVQRYLDRRRPLGTEVHVAGPVYVPVTVAASLHVGLGQAGGVAAAAQSALDRYFDPLTGGPAGAGWPLGRDVLDSDLLAVLNQIAGVLYVDGLTISTSGRAAPQCGNLNLCGIELVRSQTHRLTVLEQ